MAKINIIKPTGSEAFNLISAFKEDENTYIVFDSERMGSMGLPIIYISKFNGKLEKINDANEWQSVKNYLKGIINGTNFHYVKIDESVNADEAYYTPLTLPQASFDMIKSRYVVTEDTTSTNGENTDAVARVMEAPVQAPTMPEVPIVNNVSEPVTPVAPMPDPVPPIAPVAPVMPTVEPVSNMTSTINTPSIVVEPLPSEPTLEPIVNPVPPVETPQVNEAPEVPKVSSSNLESNFIKDKETFLKACENMFDALVSKYEKQFHDIEKREQAVMQKEQEIENKLKNANEHLANAEAREQVANIAHDNAQRVMDFSNFMPSNPNGNQTGVI